MDENLKDARGKKQQAKGRINWGHTDKAVWDWVLLLCQMLGAIAIPFVILIVGLYFTGQNTQQQALLSERQHQTDLQTAAGQQQDTTLKVYLDDMSNMLLSNNLLESQSGAEIRQVAKERTLTTLRRLDADHNRILLQFLRDAHLIGVQNAVINLSNADLSGVGNLTQQQLDTVSLCANANLLLTGLRCPHSASMVTLTYWYTEGTAETPVILQRVQQFQQLNPDIKIIAVPKPFFQTQAAFITAAQTGNAPDVLRSDVSWVPQFASQHYLLNIDSYISPSDHLSDYLNAPLSYDMYNGHFYGLPQVTDFLALLYNQTELTHVGITSAPATMTDFEAAAMKIVQSRAATYGFETDGQAYYMLPFLWAFGGGMFDQHNNILVNNSGSIAGLTFLLKLQNTDQVMPAKVDFSNGYNNMVNDFKSGKTAMIFDGPYEVSNILTGSAFKGNPSNLGIAAVPMGLTGQRGSPLGGQSYVIYAHTAHPDEAYRFISYMSSTASQIAIAKVNHTLPTRQSAYQDPGASRDAAISEFYSIHKTAMPRPTIPQGGFLFDAFDPNILAALDGAENPTDALNAVADAWKQLLGCPTGVNCFFTQASFQRKP